MARASPGHGLSRTPTSLRPEFAADDRGCGQAFATRPVMPLTRSFGRALCAPTPG
jgi:hypothetical protein